MLHRETTRPHLWTAIKVAIFPIATATAVVTLEGIRAKKNKRFLLKQMQVDWQHVQQSKNILDSLQTRISHLPLPFRRSSKTQPKVASLTPIEIPVEVPPSMRQPTHVISLSDMPQASHEDVTVTQTKKEKDTLTSATTISANTKTIDDHPSAIPFAVTSSIEQDDGNENPKTLRRLPYWFDD